jgi:hypothetical protein
MSSVHRSRRPLILVSCCHHHSFRWRPQLSSHRSASCADHQSRCMDGAPCRHGRARAAISFLESPLSPSSVVPGRCASTIRPTPTHPPRHTLSAQSSSSLGKPRVLLKMPSTQILRALNRPYSGGLWSWLNPQLDAHRDVLRASIFIGIFYGRWTTPTSGHHLQRTGCHGRALVLDFFFILALLKKFKK